MIHNFSPSKKADLIEKNRQERTAEFNPHEEYHDLNEPLNDFDFSNISSSLFQSQTNNNTQADQQAIMQAHAATAATLKAK